MSELLAYLLKVHIALVIFYLIYRWFLRKLTFYNLNRYYLLGTMAFSAIYPLIDFRQFWEKEVPIHPEWVQFVPNLQQKIQFEEVVLFTLEVVFWALFTFFLLRFGMRLMSLWQLHRRSVSARWFDIPYRRVFEKINPFSFLHHIYVNTDCHKENELSDIFMHEYVHVKEKHSWDMIFVEVFTAFGWFNPVVWLYRFAIHENLEFITDRRVLESGVDKQLYQFSLLNISVPHEVQFGGSMVSHFNLRQLKRRISMMNTQDSSKLKMGRYVFSIPIVFGLIVVFGFAKGYQNKEIVHYVVQNYTQATQSPIYTLMPRDSSFAYFERIEDLTDKSASQHPAIQQKELVDTPAQRLVIKKVDVALDSQKLLSTHDSKQALGLHLKGVATPPAGNAEVRVIYDGVRISQQALKDINPNQIASISVIKHEPHSFIYVMSKDYHNSQKEDINNAFDHEFGDYLRSNVLPKRGNVEKGVQNVKVQPHFVPGQEVLAPKASQAENLEVVVVGYPTTKTSESTPVKTVTGKPVTAKPVTGKPLSGKSVQP